MASVFKRKRDQCRKGSSWYFSFDDERGRRRTRKGFTDKRATESLATEVELQVRRRKSGLIDAQDEFRQTAMAMPIEQHLSAFEQSLHGTSDKHRKLVMGRLRRLVRDAKIATLRDIDAEAIEALLVKRLTSGNVGNRTYNHYLQAMHQLCEWLVPKRLTSNPLLGAKRRNVEVDIRHKRRALTADEFAKLIASARQSAESIQCFNGEERARIYTLSYLTGLRRGELASLTPASFDLDGPTPTVTVEAACSKHRRKDTLPLHPELISQLRVWLAGVFRDQLLFPKLAKRRTWLMVKKDLERVGIPYETEAGIADFHAAGRHSHITELLRNGASLPEARELARHSDVRMTMRYTHIGLGDQARAIAKLPWKELGEVTEGELPAQRPDSGTLHATRRQQSPPVTNSDADDLATGSANPLKTATCDTSRHRQSAHGTTGRNAVKSGGGGNRRMRRRFRNAYATERYVAA